MGRGDRARGREGVRLAAAASLRTARPFASINCDACAYPASTAWSKDFHERKPMPGIGGSNRMSVCSRAWRRWVSLPTVPERIKIDTIDGRAATLLAEKGEPRLFAEVFGLDDQIFVSGDVDADDRTLRVSRHHVDREVVHQAAVDEHVLFVNDRRQKTRGSPPSPARPATARLRCGRSRGPR